LNDSADARRQRLAQTIAWCGLQKLVNKPIESGEIKQRRALGERAANHAFAAHQLESASLFKWINRKKVKTMRDEASQMHREARLDEIRPLATQLRAPALKPTADFVEGQSEEARAAIVESVSIARAKLLIEKGIEVPAAGVDLAGGKLLRYTPCGSIADRSPGYESKGFFDWECAPPWDTWVCYDEGRLLAYVPRLLCALVQSGIEVDPAECLDWANDAFVARVFGAAFGTSDDL
jgi:hypothetical protein